MYVCMYVSGTDVAKEAAAMVIVDDDFSTIVNAIEEGNYIHTYMHTYIHIYTYIHTHTYIYTYIYTYIHTYTHAYMQT